MTIMSCKYPSFPNYIHHQLLIYWKGEPTFGFPCSADGKKTKKQTFILLVEQRATWWRCGAAPTCCSEQSDRYQLLVRHQHSLQCWRLIAGNERWWRGDWGLVRVDGGGWSFDSCSLEGETASPNTNELWINNIDYRIFFIVILLQVTRLDRMPSQREK